MPRIVQVTLVGGISGGIVGFGLTAAGAPLWFVLICCAVLGAAIGKVMR